MLGKTHIAAGVTAALLLLHPTTVLGIGAAVAGGALGGAVCDIDCKGTKRSRDAIKGGVIAAVCIAVVIAVDLYLGNGLINAIRNTVGTQLLCGCIGFIACCFWGALSPHRTFTHSAVGLFLMSLCVWLVCRPLGVAVFAGMTSHILLDLLNRRRIALLYPLRKPAFCLRLCDSDGVVNRVLAWGFTAVSVILLLYFGSKVLTGR